MVNGRRGESFAALQRPPAAVHLICLDTSLEIGIMRPVSPDFTRITIIKKGLRIDGDSCDSLESFSLCHTMIVAGLMIGSGIFIVPAGIARREACIITQGQH
ncbi:MAG TPA: hypothetical protein VEY11_15180 [Pyrinomonadaceae bacterium]|nr:hypothetical protein [Pyrinomonadaceae bacterium]